MAIAGVCTGALSLIAVPILLAIMLPSLSRARELSKRIVCSSQLQAIGMAMTQYFTAFGPQVERLRTKGGTVSAIAGILKAPLDIIADKMRGYLGLVDDLFERPKKVLAACEALAPHLAYVAKTTGDPDRNVPGGLWMHRGGVPVVSPKIFENV